MSNAFPQDQQYQKKEYKPKKDSKNSEIQRKQQGPRSNNAQNEYVKYQEVKPQVYSNEGPLPRSEFSASISNFGFEQPSSQQDAHPPGIVPKFSETRNNPQRHSNNSGKFNQNSGPRRSDNTTNGHKPVNQYETKQQNVYQKQSQFDQGNFPSLGEEIAPKRADQRSAQFTNQSGNKQRFNQEQFADQFNVPQPKYVQQASVSHNQGPRHKQYEGETQYVPIGKSSGNNNNTDSLYQPKGLPKKSKNNQYQKSNANESKDRLASSHSKFFDQEPQQQSVYQERNPQPKAQILKQIGVPNETKKQDERFILQQFSEKPAPAHPKQQQQLTNPNAVRIPPELEQYDGDVIENLFDGYNDVNSDHWQDEEKEAEPANRKSTTDSIDSQEAQKKAQARKKKTGQFLKYLKDVDIYHAVRSYWNALIESTDHDEEKAYKLVTQTHTNFIDRGDDYMLKGCLVLIFTEDGLGYLADDLLYKNPELKKMKAVEEASKVLKNKEKHDMYAQPPKDTPKIKYLSLGSFKFKESAVSFIDKFDFHSKGWNMAAFEKIKLENLVSITEQLNPYQNEYISVLQIATAEHVYVFDLIALCAHSEKIMALVDFLISLIGSKSTYIVSVDGRGLMMNLIKSLFVTNEYQYRALVAKKVDFCRMLEENEHRILDIRHYMPGKSFQEIIETHCKGKYSRELEYSDWIKRPLQRNQEYFAAFKAYALLRSYKSIISEVQLS